MKNAIFILFLFLSAHAYAQKCNCDSTFKKVRLLVEFNYAGWFDKTKHFDTAEFTKFTNRIANRCHKITNADDCADAILEWTKYFKDENLKIYFDPTLKTHIPKNLQTETNEVQEIKVLKSKLDVKGCIDYLKSAKKLRKIEGIWENESYKIAIVKSDEKPDTYMGVIISSVYSNWKSNEIKFDVKENRKNEFSMVLTMRDKDNQTTPTVKILDDVMDADPLFMQRIFPTTKSSFDFEEYVNKNASYIPATSKIKFVSDNLAVIKIPNFTPENNILLQKAIQKNAQHLSTTPYLIIDLRGNNGGEIEVAKLLFPFLYTKPIVWFNCKHRATKENYEKWFKKFIKTDYDKSTKKERAEFDSIETIVKKNFGGFHNFYNENQIADTFYFAKTMASPKKIGILINNSTISGGELFTMLARQSDKVVVYGQKSYGLLDYDRNVLYPTNCPSISVGMPILRSNWLDYGISIDKDKIKPDVLISENNDDWIKFAYKDLLKREKQ